MNTYKQLTVQTDVEHVEEMVGIIDSVIGGDYIQEKDTIGKTARMCFYFEPGIDKEKGGKLVQKIYDSEIAERFSFREGRLE